MDSGKDTPVRYFRKGKDHFHHKVIQPLRGLVGMRGFFYFKRGNFSSTGKLAFNQASQPPLRAPTRLYPLDKGFRANLALVLSLTHTQYKTSALSRGKSLAHDLNFFCNRLTAPLILTGLDCQSRPRRTSMITTSGTGRLPVKDLLTITLIYTIIYHYLRFGSNVYVNVGRLNFLNVFSGHYTYTTFL